MTTYRLGFIGCGNFSRFHFHSIAEDVPELKIVALCDPSEENLRSRKKEWLGGRKVRTFSDHRKMLESMNLDAVFVCSPHTLHYRHCSDALDAGCHVLVDKPMVTDSDHARNLTAKARRKGLNLQIAIQGLYLAASGYTRRFLADGQAGELQIANSFTSQHWLELTTGKWRQDPKLSGGGQLYDSSSHAISAMMYLVDSPVEEVYCLLDRKGTKVDINAVASLRFANGALGAILSGGNSAAWNSRVTLQCTEGVVQFSTHPPDFAMQLRNRKRVLRSVPKNWPEPTVSPARNFADVLLGLAEPRFSNELGVRLADLMDALYASAKTGKPVKVKA